MLGLDIRTYQRWRQAETGEDKRKAAAAERVPANKLSETERAAILSCCNSAEHRSLPPSQIVPRLADQGQYLASESSFYRVLRDAGQNHRRGRAAAPSKVAKPTAHCAQKPNELWSWDISYLASSIRGQFYRLYLVMDVFSRKIVGWEVHEDESSEHASALISRACWAEHIRADQLVLHSDNGSPMKGATMLATLQRLGVMPSFNRPSVSDDNPYSESLFRTLKYGPMYPSKPFADLQAARQWVQGFVQWYNHEHRHSGIRYVTPSERHSGRDRVVLAKRHELYEKAKAAHPERWSGETRNWNFIETVWLNPDREGDRTTEANGKAA